MQKRLNSTRNLFGLLVAIGVIAVVAFAASTSPSVSSKTLDAAIDPPPPLDAPMTPPPVDVEKDAEFFKQQVAAMEKTTVVTNLSGPETAGAEIVVAGKKIKMPDDAEMFGVEMFLNCPVFIPKCGQPPLLRIKRGDNPIEDAIAVELISGEIWPEIKSMETHPDEYLAKFSFLIDALGKDKVVDVIALRQETNAILEKKLEESRGK